MLISLRKVLISYIFLRNTCIQLNEMQLRELLFETEHNMRYINCRILFFASYVSVKF